MVIVEKETMLPEDYQTRMLATLQAAMGGRIDVTRSEAVSFLCSIWLPTQTIEEAIQTLVAKDIAHQLALRQTANVIVCQSG